MSDNRFKHCGTAEGVLLSYSQIYDQNPRTRADALARIAELTPRTVDEAGKCRAANELRKRVPNADELAIDLAIEAIIDALGYTVAPQPKQEVAHDYFDTLVVPAARNDDDHGIGLDGRCDTCERPEPATPAEPEVRDRAISGVWLSGLMSWNIDTFGPGLRTEGVTDHIARELDEIRKAPTDLTEWADVILLALAGAVRAAGAEGEHPRRVIDAVLDKHQRNLQRKWPDWRTAERGKAIEHVRDTEPADAPHQCADVADDCCEPTPAPATPAVELDADDLNRLSEARTAWAKFDAELQEAGYGNLIGNRMPFWLLHGRGRISIVRHTPDGEWVLRIGGGQ